MSGICLSDSKLYLISASILHNLVTDFSFTKTQTCHLIWCVQRVWRLLLKAHLDIQHSVAICLHWSQSWGDKKKIKMLTTVLQWQWEIRFPWRKSTESDPKNPDSLSCTEIFLSLRGHFQIKLSLIQEWTDQKRKIMVAHYKVSQHKYPIPSKHSVSAFCQASVLPFFPPKSIHWSILWLVSQKTDSTNWMLEPKI